MSRIRIACICDYLEAGWSSMDFCAEMLFYHLLTDHSAVIQSEQIRPVFRQRLKHIPWLSKRGSAHDIDWMLNCFWDYPCYLGRQAANFDLFHICDHSYAQLVNVLPPERTGVYCHDIDAFRALLGPKKRKRFLLDRKKFLPSIRYETMGREVLRGLQKAAVVFYSTAEVRKEIEYYDLLDPSRLVQAPLGIAPEFSPIPPQANSADQQVIAQVGEQPFVLCVSSNQERKRLDVLLDVFAAVWSTYRDLRLVRVGPDWEPLRHEQIARLGIGNSIIRLQGLKRTGLAELYRRASLVLVTSEAEGFGLPVIEALACGSIVVASKIPVLREVGGSAVVYCPVADVPAWVETVKQLLSNPTVAPSQATRLSQANKYSWFSHTQKIAQTYLRLAGSLPSGR